MKQYCVYLLILFLCIMNLYNIDCKKSHAKKNKFQKFQTETESLAPKKPKNKQINYDFILQPDEKLEILKSDWLQISSPFFKNTQKFPPLILPDGKQVVIHINDGYFRINEDWKSSKDGPSSDLYFWFRLSGRNLYYSTNKEDINVLGSIAVQTILDLTPSKPYNDDPKCFSVTDTSNEVWKLCTQNMKSKIEWVCMLKTELKLIPDKYECEKAQLADSEVTVLTKKVTQPIILIPQPSKSCNESWDYSKKGEDWECECREGKEQSPIDLPSKGKTITTAAKPLFQYDEIFTTFQTTTAEGRVTTDKLRIEYSDGVLKIPHNHFGKIVTLDGAVYTAQNIIFHTPSEHTIDGKRYDMEMQIIHFGQTKGDIAKQVVLSFLFEKKPGKYNKFIDDVDFFNLPSASMKERDILNNLYIPKILHSSEEDDIPIMKPFSFYTYQGSIPYPPCSERTVVYVAANPIPLGTTAITLFEEANRLPDVMDSAGNVIVNTLGSSNIRNTQPLNGRAVFYYDHVKHCGPDPVPRPKGHTTPGHFEKVVRKNTEYFYVNSEKPSGLPNSFVVSETEAKGILPAN